MQLEQNIPTLGGLGGPPQRSRREQLASDGERARGEIASLLGKAHRRVLALAGARAGALLLAGLSLALLAGALVWAVVTSLADRYVSRGLVRLWAGDSGAPPVELSPIAGDLSVTYLYPAYTGLPPRTEEGTAGDLRAPRGTEVRIAARADRDLSQAFALVNGTAVELEATGPGHRQLAGTFALMQAGQWNLRFADARGRTIAQGPSRPIEIVAHQAPQVSVDAPKQAVHEVDPQGRGPLGR